MAVEYRPARPEEMREFAYGGAIGFGESTADSVIDHRVASGSRQPEWTLCAFDDGVMASKMATQPFVMRWNGRDIGCGGVTSVSTLPSHRRRGYLRELMTRAFATMREREQPVAMLWASMAAIYQRFGYGIAYPQHAADFDPRTVRFNDQIETPGRLRMVRGQEVLPALRDTYTRFAAPRTLALQRNDAFWTNYRLRHWNEDDPPSLYAIYEEAGETLGYVIYDIGRERRSGPDQQVRVGELVWLTPGAHRALMQYLLAHDLAYSVTIRLPVDDPLFHHVQEPRALNLSVSDGTLVRVVDLVPALEGRGYDTDGAITFSLADELCPWNAGTWTLTVEGGAGRVQRATAEPQLQLTQRALAMLAAGYTGATLLARAGIIPPADARALRCADDLFRIAYAPFCLDNF